MNTKLIEKFKYCLGISYSRKILNNILNENRNYFHGSVLDIGGGKERGKFVRPKTEKWISADISSELQPDFVCNVEKMPFENESFDVIKATQIFEHVENPEIGVKECFRVLKKEGYFIISAPFIYPLHGDPCDFQRWTKNKWEKVLSESEFKIEKLCNMGGYFIVLIDMLRNFNASMPSFFRYLGYFIYPFYYLLIQLDKTGFVLKNNRLNKYTSGYFIIAKK